MIQEFTPELLTQENMTNLTETACRLFNKQIQAKENSVVVLPMGRTQLPMYEQLAAQKEQQPFHYVQLDEYLGTETDNPNLLYRQLYQHFLGPIKLPEGLHHIFNLKAKIENEILRIEERVKDLGGVDLAILGLGENGHCGFNEPGTDFDAPTHVVTLDEKTRQQNAALWDGIENMPRQAITLGLGTLSKARQTILMVSSESKAEILQRVLNGPITPDVPATYLRTIPNVTILADKLALGA